jgi:hypothetical protein
MGNNFMEFDQNILYLNDLSHLAPASSRGKEMIIKNHGNLPDA